MTPALAKLAGNSSAPLSGSGSVARVPMYSHLPAGGVADGVRWRRGALVLAVSGRMAAPRVVRPGTTAEENHGNGDD